MLLIEVRVCLSWNKDICVQFFLMHAVNYTSAIQHKPCASDIYDNIYEKIEVCLYNSEQFALHLSMMRVRVL